MASRRPRMRTASMSTVETVQGTHSFKITSYSLHRQLSIDKCFCSAIFAVGGHNWRIRYYYEGQDFRDQYDSVFLELTGEPVEVTASFGFKMVNPATSSSSLSDTSPPVVFNGENLTRGFTSFMMKNEVSQKYVQDDCLVIECDVTVIKELQVKETAVTSDFDIHVPAPSDLSHDLRRLLESEEEADVTFKVKGEVFRAHKIVLAMRSPVFKAELYGPMRGDKGTESKTVEGMDPAIFKALLHFIYTDSFPAMEGLGCDEEEDMVKHLLVAADTYGMERMKLVCENILCKRIDVESVAYTLVLAGQHHCRMLKNACIEFIISRNRMDIVLAGQGYEHLRRACPEVAVELWEKAAKSCKTRSSSDILDGTY